MNDHVRVEFKTIDGVTLRGDFFQARGRNAPCVVMAQGLTLLKEHYIHAHARKFVEAGFSALVYDHRGYGSSDGLPRHETNPQQQAEDYHDAITAAMELPGVDRNRIVIWGIGHSGGASMIAAASEPRVAAIILNMPFVSGAMEAAKYPAGFLEKVWADREMQTRSGNPQPTYMPMWPTSLEHAKGAGEWVFLGGEIPYNFITRGMELSTRAGTPWENKVTLQTFYHLAKAEPRLHLPLVDASKMLYIAARMDPLSAPPDVHQEIFDTAKPGGEFVVVEPDHLGTYFGEYFDATMKVQVDFLKRKLG